MINYLVKVDQIMYILTYLDSFIFLFSTGSKGCKIFKNR